MTGLIIVVIALVNIGLGFLVLLKNPTKVVNRRFFALTIAVSAWSAANFLADTSSNPLLWNRATFFAAVLIAASFAAFVRVFPAGTKPRSVQRVVLASVLLAVFVCTPYVVTDVTPRIIEGQIVGYSPVYGWGYIVFGFGFLAIIGSSIHHIVRKARHLRGAQRTRVLYFTVGCSLAIGVGIVTNLLLPSLFDYRLLVPYGGYAMLIFTSAVAYSMIRHRLFSMRMVVARTAAYVLTLLLVAALYFGAIILFSTLLISRQPLGWTEMSLYFLLSLVFAVSFQWVLRLFTKLTQRVFYRDAYDSQDVLAHIGHVLESEIRLGALAQGALSEMCQSLHLSRGQLLVLDREKIIENATYGPQDTDYIDSFSQLAHFNKKIIVADELEDGVRLAALEKHRYRVAIQLHSKDEYLGYILLGDKLDGDIYGDKDIKLLEIIARDISVSILNAKSYEEIAAFNETLQDKVKQATRELQRTNEKLRALDEAKDEFVSMASHQLRTPLTSVKGYVSMVLEGDAGELSAQQRQFLEQAYNSSQRMVYLIADLLNVSRLKTGTFVIEKSEVYLPDIVEAEVSQLLETARSREVALRFEKPEHFPSLLLDETKIRQVVMNFTDNAIYYTPRGGRIDVKLFANDQSVEFRVTDTGIGVPTAEKHKLFTKFYRAANARKARPDGTGLGLYMAKKVITAQGGAVLFKTQEGRGSTFGFTFPLTALAPRHIPPAIKADT